MFWLSGILIKLGGTGRGIHWTAHHEGAGPERDEFNGVRAINDSVSAAVTVPQSHGTRHAIAIAVERNMLRKCMNSDMQTIEWSTLTW